MAIMVHGVPHHSCDTGVAGSILGLTDYRDEKQSPGVSWPPPPMRGNHTMVRRRCPVDPLRYLRYPVKAAGTFPGGCGLGDHVAVVAESSPRYGLRSGAGATGHEVHDGPHNPARGSARCGGGAVRGGTASIQRLAVRRSHRGGYLQNADAPEQPDDPAEGGKTGWSHPFPRECVRTAGTRGRINSDGCWAIGGIGSGGH